MKCLLLINASSGNSGAIAEDKELLSVLQKAYDTVVKKVYRAEDSFDIAKECEGYDVLVLCGGDGTFNYAINALRHSKIELIYLPCGTFNDCAHTLEKLDSEERKGQFRLDLGEINGRLFSYVAAAGSFTPIGYLPKSKYKKVFKRLVYYFYALKEYKVHRINAKIKADGKTYEDCYTLIMAANSRYVFGFSFNRIFNLNDGKGQLLLIKSPKKGPLGFIKLFLLFFRAFFIGFDAEYDGKDIKFISFRRCLIHLDAPVDFCVDGEKLTSGGVNEISMHKERSRVILTGTKGFLSD